MAKILLVEDDNLVRDMLTISGGGRLDPTGYLDLSESLGASVSFEKPIDNNALLMAIDLLLHGRGAH
jgi:hypothetical protein